MVGKRNFFFEERYVFGCEGDTCSHLAYQEHEESGVDLATASSKVVKLRQPLGASIMSTLRRPQKHRWYPANIPSFSTLTNLPVRYMWFNQEQCHRRPWIEVMERREWEMVMERREWERVMAVFFSHKGPEWRGFRKVVSMVTTAGTRIPHKELNTGRLIKFPSTWPVHIKPLHQQEFRNT